MRRPDLQHRQSGQRGQHPGARRDAGREVRAHPLRDRFPPFAGIHEIESGRYYGSGYQDVTHRRPSIANARNALGWKPVIALEDSVERTLDFFLRDYIERLDAAPAEPAAGRAKPAAAREGLVQKGAVTPTLSGCASTSTRSAARATASRACSRLLAEARRERDVLLHASAPTTWAATSWRLLQTALLREDAALARREPVRLGRARCAGTFWPGPRIGAALGPTLRDAESAGHEIGLHAWDHHRWQVVGAQMDARALHDEIAARRRRVRRGTRPPARLLGGRGLDLQRACARGEGGVRLSLQQRLPRPEHLRARRSAAARLAPQVPDDAADLRRGHRPRGHE